MSGLAGPRRYFVTVLDGDVLRVTANFELGDGTQYQNVYHYIRDGTDPQSDASHINRIETAMEAMYGELEAFVKNDTVEQLSTVDRVEFNEIVNEWRVVENIGVFTTVFTPVGAVDALPYQSSPYVVFKTQRPKSVGKKYLFPFIETAQADTILTGAAVTALVAYGVEALGHLLVGGDVTLAPVIVRTAFNTVLPLLVAVVNDVLGSQKRRRPGVGA